MKLSKRTARLVRVRRRGEAEDGWKLERFSDRFSGLCLQTCIHHIQGMVFTLSQNLNRIINRFYSVQGSRMRYYNVFFIFFFSFFSFSFFPSFVSFFPIKVNNFNNPSNLITSYKSQNTIHHVSIRTTIHPSL